MKYRAVVITISDKGSAGERVDTSGPGLRSMLQKTYEVAEVVVIPDEIDLHRGNHKGPGRSKRHRPCRHHGGNRGRPAGRHARGDPHGNRKRPSGFSEIMRMESFRVTPFALISRAVCGIRRQSIIVNLPGSPKAAAECLSFIEAALPHALEKVKGDPSECAR